MCYVFRTNSTLGQSTDCTEALGFAFFSDPLIETLHRALQPVADNRLDCFGSPLNRGFEVRTRLCAHPFQQIILALALARRPADTDAHPNEIRRAQRLLDRSHPAIAGVASALLETQPPRDQIELVMNDDQSRSRNLIIAKHRGETFAAAVVVGLRLDQ